MSQTGYNYTSSNHIKATAAVLLTPRGHDTRKVLLMHSDHTPNALSAQPETKLIPLTQGKFAIVDAADYEWLMQWKWYAIQSGNTWYARRAICLPDGRHSTVGMHRLVMGIGDSLVDVDHKDRDGLNNTRGNLRRATNSQNQYNKGVRSDSKTGVKGVYRHKRSGRWVAYIRVDGKSKHLGIFDTPEEAAEARDRAAIKLHGEYALTNADIL